jgi:sporulation integral membrane protein YtvI
MDSFLDRARKFNGDWNDLPRRALIVLATCIALVVALAAFPYFAPFVCALVFSWVIRPLARPINWLFAKIRIPKSIGTLLAVVIVFGLIVTGLALLTSALIGEARDLLVSLPRYQNDAVKYITDQAGRIQAQITDTVGDEALRWITDMLTSALSKLAEMASTFAGHLVSFTWSAVTVLPEVLLFVIFMIMESYYIVADSVENDNFTKKWLPARVMSGYGRVKKVMLLGVRAQVVTAIVQMFIAMAVLLAGFFVLNIEYAVMFAILISVLDALPVIGAGLVMLPMTGYYVIVGDYMLALGVMVLYCIMLIVKRIMEPKLLGKQMRLRQLTTMVAMYAGFRVMGFIGLITGPLTLLLFKVVLSDATEKVELPEASKKYRRKS